MAEIISLFGNGLGYPHVICTPCNGNEFHIEVFENDDGVYQYSHLVCVKCGNRIPIDIRPVFGPEGG